MPENLMDPNGTDREEQAHGWSRGIGSFWNDLNGTTGNNEFSSAEAEKARLFNSAEAQKNRDWQEYMSNTALQRQVEDAKKAGINPASLNGDGASSPGGSAASAQAAHASPTGSSGFLGLIGSVASAAIGKALYAKYMNTALQAKQEFQLPKLLSAVERDKATAKKMLADSELKKQIIGAYKAKRAKGSSSPKSDWQGTDEEYNQIEKEFFSKLG